jgi:curved DNA-binding protein CbpA
VKTSRNLYEVLRIPREASQDDIRKAHRRLVREHHPDANPGDGSAEGRFKEIQQAYEVLSDPERKREYDNRLRASSGRSSGRQRTRGTRGGGRTGGETATTVDLSDLLSKLSDHSGGSREGSFQLGGEEIARLTRLFGMDISRFSKLLGEQIKTNTATDPGKAGTGEASATDEAPSSGNHPGAAHKLRPKQRKKKVKVKRAQSREKKVKGPKARRRRKAD